LTKGRIALRYSLVSLHTFKQRLKTHLFAALTPTILHTVRIKPLPG